MFLLNKEADQTLWDSPLTMRICDNDSLQLCFNSI